MAGSQHTVSMAFVRSAVAALDSGARETALRSVAIPPDLLAADGARVPAEAFAGLWMAVADVLDDEFFGLDSRRMKVGSFALLCHSVAGQATVERGLKQAIRGFALLLDDIEARLEVSNGEASLSTDNRIRMRRGGTDARRFADETLLVMLHGLLCWLAGRRVPLRRLEWSHPRPAHADEYRRMFAPELRFDAPASALVFDARVLQPALQVGPASLKAFLRDAPQSVFLKQVQQRGWGERVRRELRHQFTDDAGHAHAATLEALAQQFGLSPATLRRRLDDEATGWQQLKDEIRRDLAIHHLADGRLSIEAVAAQLGFTDASSFHRAFRKWTGTAPGAWRADSA
jgi:AraC-like DNA-binding protein